MKKIISTLLILLAMLSCLAFGGCDYSYLKARQLTYTQWTDESGKIFFRTVTGGFGNGTIVLNGKEVEAGFNFGLKSSIYVYILEDSLDYDYTGDGGDGELIESFATSDINNNGQVVSDENDVVLFGEHFGRVVLTPTPIDRDTVDAWEYYDNWSDSDNQFTLIATPPGYYSRKCRGLLVKTSEGKKSYIFQWLPEKKAFAIYADTGCGYINGNEEILAEGTYTNECGKAILTFTEDKIFNGIFTVLEIQVEHN